MTDDVNLEDGEVVSPSGLAVVGALFGVFTGYFLSISFLQMFLLPSVIIVGVVGAGLAHEIEYQILKRKETKERRATTKDNGQSEKADGSEITTELHQFSALNGIDDEIIFVSSDSGVFSIYDPTTGAIGTGETKRTAILRFAEAIEDIEEVREQDDFQLTTEDIPPWFNGGSSSSA